MKKFILSSPLLCYRTHEWIFVLLRWLGCDISSLKGILRHVSVFCRWAGQNFCWGQNELCQSSLLRPLHRVIEVQRRKNHFCRITPGASSRLLCFILPASYRLSEDNRHLSDIRFTLNILKYFTWRSSSFRRCRDEIWYNEAAATRSENVTEH